MIVLSQEDFFIILHNILSEMEEVTELQPVPDAHVPVMRFKFLGMSIDLLYASISLLVVPEVSLDCSFLSCDYIILFLPLSFHLSTFHSNFYLFYLCMPHNPLKGQPNCI